MSRRRDEGQRGLYSGDSRNVPLAARMRPRTFEEFVGQAHLLGPGKPLRRVLESGNLTSMIFWGPPGSGKTTLALLIAGAVGAHFERLSAVMAGVADVRRIAEEARHRLEREGRRTVLFLDEVHRFNRAQQDSVLPYVEDGTLIFLGATTENPSFSIIGPLLSRCRVYRLEPLTPEEVRIVVQRAVVDAERGLGQLKIGLTPEALDYLVHNSGGDARVALTVLEMAANVALSEGSESIGPSLVAEIFQRRILKEGASIEAHYDMTSALIKAIRASDPDAAIYWLARLLESEEDPLFVARRLVISAAEDIGLADPQALVVAVAAQQAAYFVGMPEAFLPLSEAALYLAVAPKSNSALRAYLAARSLIDEKGELPVPMFLRNAPTGLMRAEGYGKGYRYAHEESQEAERARREGRPFQNCLPSELSGYRLYMPGRHGWEAEQPWWPYRAQAGE